VQRSDDELVAALRRGDHDAFAEIVDAWSPGLLRLARMHVPSHAVAEEVVQEAWLGVLNGLDRFEARSSLRTWILRILVNKAKTRGAREARSVPFASLAPRGEEPAVEPERFRGPDDPFPGHWRAYPGNWQRLPDEALTERETLAVVIATIEQLPVPQRLVITMRDIQGCGPEEVCEVLDVSEGNQRVLLHRARSKVRRALERHLDG
jgi:RNA polymerase sigma-70 factor (ECF subfamily)